MALIHWILIISNNNSDQTKQGCDTMITTQLQSRVELKRTDIETICKNSYQGILGKSLKECMRNG